MTSSIRYLAHNLYRPASKRQQPKKKQPVIKKNSKALTDCIDILSKLKTLSLSLPPSLPP